MNDDLPRFVDDDEDDSSSGFRWTPAEPPSLPESEFPTPEKVKNPGGVPRGLFLTTPSSEEADELEGTEEQQEDVTSEVVEIPDSFETLEIPQATEVDETADLETIPEEDMRGYIAALRARGTLPPLEEPTSTTDEDEDTPAVSKEQLEKDIQLFLRLTSAPPAEEKPTPPEEDPPQAEVPGIEAASLIEEEAEENDLQQFLTDLRENPQPSKAYEAPAFVDEDENLEFEFEEEPLPDYLNYSRDSSPSPETQSGFVNPALARVAASRPKGRQREPGELWLAIRTTIIVLAAALIVAFIFNYWTPDSFLSEAFVANLQEVSSTQGPATAVPSPLPTFSRVQKVGLIIGHSGPPLNPQFDRDPGAICDENNDGIPELEELVINTTVGERVAELLVAAGYEIELLNEWDARIDNYRANILLSIHTNTCENLGEGATGFNVKASERSPMIDRDNQLVDCLVANYANATGMPRHFGSPPDLVDYHAFREVSIDTPTVIIELGFMFANRDVLTTRPEDMAQGIFRGLDCFLSPSSSDPAPSTSTQTPIETSTAIPAS
jgi:N-acetylmuramoyl-L-alanine amidase